MPPRNAHEAAMDAAEQRLSVAANRAVRDFLERTTDEAVEALSTSALVAAARPSLTLGEMFGWWTASVNEHLSPALERVWRDGYRNLRVRGGTVSASSLDALTEFTRSVSDRLVRGLTPPLPSDAFTAVRRVITTGAAQGWSTRDTATRLGKELGWARNPDYWSRELRRVNTGIDSILDPLGKPGHPTREAARMRDPRVAALQADRAGIVKHIDADASHWQNRANLIARTETTGAYNYGALSALDDEGMRWKRWLATADARTRLTHRVADGQIVKTREPFIVGGYEMQHPGAMSAPPEEVANCRCTVIGADRP